VYGGSVSAPNAPNCNHALESPAEPGLLPPNGFSLTYSCSVSGVGASFTNVVTASGQSQNGDPITASGSAQVTVNVAPPANPPSPPTNPNPPAPKVVQGKTMTGTAHGDHLTGTAGDDVIRGLGGNDVLNGGKGNDTIFGGAGDDRISGGPGRDKLFGGPGNDVIAAADGARDTIDCGAGDDSVTADKTDVVAKNCEHVHRTNSL
jgi:Ca2+-binding RTX toxin-like protein